MPRSLVLPLLLLAAACASRSAAHGGSAAETATGLAFTHTYAVHFGEGDTAGYVVEFFKTPEGIVDDRGYPVGTLLVQDLDLRTIGFITPGRHAWRFDEQGDTEDLGYGARDSQVADLLGQQGKLRYVAVTPDAPPAGASPD